MSGIYIPGDKVPTKCVGCGFRDPEYGGNCVLMPSFDAETYEEQFDRCLFKELRKQFGSVPEHGRLIDADEEINKIKRVLSSEFIIRQNWSIDTVSLEFALKNMADAPTIIPADKEGE